MLSKRDFSRFVPYYFKKRKGVLIEKGKKIPFEVRLAKKGLILIFFALWLYPSKSKREKREVSFKWDEVEFNDDLTEIKNKEVVLEFKPA